MLLRNGISSRKVGLIVVVLAVLLRAFPVLYWGDLYFNADSAVMGLMAKHVAEGRAFPVFQYGAPYVLVLEAYLAAPLMAISDASPALLTSVPVALNVVTVALLYWMLTGGTAALSPAMGLLATAPVALPSVSAGDELSSPLGMNIEPLLFSLIIWLLRARPIALGIVAAVAVKNREFALYALAALLFVELLHDRSVSVWRPRIASLIAFALTWSAIGFLYQHSSPLGPGTSVAMIGDARDNMALATGRLCIAPEKMPGDLWMLATELLPFQYGVRSVRGIGMGGLRVAPPDASWLWLPLVTVLAFGASRGLWRGWRYGASALTWFGMFLLLIGLQAVLVYGTTRCGNVSFSTLRYTLLSLFIAAGAIVLALERERAFATRAVVIGGCTVWIGVCALGHLTVFRSLLLTAPVGSYRQLASYLEQHNIRYILADYWTGYHVAFLTRERVRPLTPFERILEYPLAVRANMDRAVEIRRSTESRCDNAVVVSEFYVCRGP